MVAMFQEMTRLWSKSMTLSEFFDSIHLEWGTWFLLFVFIYIIWLVKE